MNKSNSPNEFSQINIYVLGRFHVERDTKEIQLSTRKTESLLCYLALNPEMHSREKLAALFWGDSSDIDARNSLRNALAVLNKKLGHDLLLADRQSVQINPKHSSWVDALEFEAQAANFLSNPDSDPSLVDLGLYRNELLIDFYDDWIFPLREHFRSLYLESLLQLTQRLRSQSEYDKALEYAQKILTFDPTNEQACQHLMFCHVTLGNRNAALKQYEVCKNMLESELGVEPSTATTALYEWIKQSSYQTHPLEAQITNLPILSTSFIGRKQELLDIKFLLRSTRLLTLSGSGGSGKTRLAIQTGIDLLDSFRDGAWWVDLSAITDNSLIAQSISKSLGVQERGDQLLTETIVNHLRSKQLLLIIDNCEHLIEECSQVIGFLIEDCPNLKIIATSRESLNIKGEQIWNAPTMALPDLQRHTLVDLLLEYEGIRLFVDRAKAVNPDFILTDENASFVVQICNHLDGIPLAIELAAARIRHLTPEQIAVRLNDRFQLLKGGRTALPRHQTLEAVMGWSYNLLTDKERILFQRLAVFSGGWILDAAEEVCPDESLNKSEVLNVLSNLVDKSLVITVGEWAGGARYRMLETIRLYADNVLKKSGEAQGVRERHLDYFLKLVKSVNPHLGFFLPDKEMISWKTILTPEIDNIRAALDFCKTNQLNLLSGLEIASILHWFWLVNNQLTEGRDWIDKLTLDSNQLPNDKLALALLSAGFISCWSGDFARARPTLEQSLNLFDGLGNKAGAAFSLHGLGFSANGLGEPHIAGPLFEKCLKIAREIDDAWLISFALHFIAIGSSFQGKHELARSQFEECIKIMKNGFGNMQGIAFSQFHLARIARLHGNYESAYTHHTEGLQIFQQIGDRRGIGYSLFGFACLAQVQEEHQRAALLFGVVDSIREDLGTLLEAILQNEYENAKSATQDVLGKDEFKSYWSKGYEIGLKQAVEFALTKN